MPSQFPVPRAEALRQMLVDLLGRKVTVTPDEVPAFEPETPGVVASYESSGVPAVALVSDVRLANILGASLTLVPPATVEESCRRNVVEDANLNNLTEVAKVLAQLHTTRDTGPVICRELIRTPGEVPDAVLALLRSPARRTLRVEVDEYGSGTLAIHVA